MRVQGLVLAGMLAACGGGAEAQPPRAALVQALSGPQASASMQVRDGFRLGLKRAAATGDAAFDLSIIDDQSDPAATAAAIRRLFEKDAPAVLVASAQPGLSAAAIKPAADAGAMVFVAGGGPAALAGRQCNANTFLTLWQDDQPIEVLARHADEAGWRRIAIVSGEDAAARDAVAAFKRQGRSDIVAELRLAPERTDFATEIEKLVGDPPQAIFLALQGPVAARFLQALGRSAALQRAALLSPGQPDVAMLGAASRDILSGTNWSPERETPESKAFVAAFEAEFGYAPDPRAVAGYDAAQLIDQALRRTKGQITDKPALRAAIRAAEIKSPRGSFSFGANNAPIQDFYLVRHSLGPEGRARTDIVKQVFSSYGDAYASECTLR